MLVCPEMLSPAQLNKASEAPLSLLHLAGMAWQPWQRRQMRWRTASPSPPPGAEVLQLARRGKACAQPVISVVLSRHGLAALAETPDETEDCDPIPTSWWVGGLLGAGVLATVILGPMMHMPLYAPVPVRICPAPCLCCADRHLIVGQMPLPSWPDGYSQLKPCMLSEHVHCVIALAAPG